jgi:hypothetical protein
MNKLSFLPFILPVRVRLCSFIHKIQEIRNICSKKKEIDLLFNEEYIKRSNQELPPQYNTLVHQIAKLSLPNLATTTAIKMA